jgi:hypothetical protein
MTRSETVVEAFDAGINFFFVTADMHWPFYEGLRKGLAALLARKGGVRDDVVVAVVTYLSRPEQMRKPFEEVIDAIPGLERIDVCVEGWAVVEDAPERRRTIVGHRDQARFGCRAMGASFHDRELVAPAVRRSEVDIAYLRYNAGHPGAREDVFPHVVAERTSLLYGFKTGMSWVTPSEVAQIPDLPEGMWCPEPADAYRFALTPPEMDGILCAPQRPKELRDLADAMERGPLEPDEEDHMIDLLALVTGDAHLDSSEDQAGTAR